jgi:U3 small nucleolar RNA-associated protein MPP10
LADEKLISRIQPGLGLNNPYEKRKMREELQMARASGKVVEGEIDKDTDFKTSAKFFQKMQANVEQSIRGDSESNLGKRKRGTIQEGSKSSSFKM